MSIPEVEERGRGRGRGRDGQKMGGLHKSWARFSDSSRVAMVMGELRRNSPLELYLSTTNLRARGPCRSGERWQLSRPPSPWPRSSGAFPRHDLRFRRPRASKGSSVAATRPLSAKVGRALNSPCPDPSCRGPRHHGLRDLRGRDSSRGSRTTSRTQCIFSGLRC